jgi:aminoglycoside/choline kinase family phosphotransferase
VPQGRRKDRTGVKLYPARPRRYLFRMEVDGVSLSRALEQHCGGPAPAVTLHKLKGDASTRSYYRLELGPGASPRTLIVMRLPEEPLGSDERSGAERVTELPFVDVQRMLARRGLPVPRIYVDDTQGRVLLLEDLGDETFAERLGRTPRAGWQALYGQAVDLLARMHRACAVAKPEESLAFRRHFDRELVRWELDHFREWGLEAAHGALAAQDREMLDRAFDALTDAVCALPSGFVHRDYQSRNLMWAGGQRLTIIDFQDALIGPAVYDLVALLCDSYVDLDASFQATMIARYGEAMGLAPEALARLPCDFAVVAAQRKLKDAGRFVFIDRVRRNPDFLRFYPQSLRYATRALQALGQREVLDLLARLMPGFPDAVTAPRSMLG